MNGNQSVFNATAGFGVERLHHDSLGTMPTNSLIVIQSLVAMPFNQLIPLGGL